MSATPIEVTVQVRALQCTPKQGRGPCRAHRHPDLIDALQKHLLVNSEKRVQDRLLWPHDLTIIPLQHDGRQDEAIVCRGKDISHTGIGFYLPHELHTADVLIELPRRAQRATRRPWCRRRWSAPLLPPDGWYEVGAIFRVPAVRRSLAEICI